MPGPAPRWRFLITPRWLGWHAFTVLAVAGMLALGWWQLRRAEAGNSLSWAYTFEWPVFAVFGVVFWAKTIRDEFSPPDTGEAPDKAEFAVRPSGAELPGGKGSATVGEDEPEDADLAAYNAYLARLQDQVKGHGRWHGLR
ncbi:MAG TPA: hypothetical protein VKS82_05500 [Streptosporangiaceae bacterium]|jgi:DNA-binding transcriptional regulator of glucitol operon|nr:hypothetical protein [Streptosporangiaceae bacterium]